VRKQNLLPTHKHESVPSSPGYTHDEDIVPARYQNAAPPVWTLVLVLVPVASAIYIASSRFTDFRHFGFDILFGSLIGITSAWFSFRLYHLPITRGAGWAWGPRSYERAWGIGVGRGNYVGSEGWSKRGESETAPKATGRESAFGNSSAHGAVQEDEMELSEHAGAFHAGTPTQSKPRSEIARAV
jgi:hypothetical protein